MLEWLTIFNVRSRHATSLAASLPENYILHLLAAFVLKNFADQRDILLKSPFFMVLNGIKAEVGKKLASIS